MFMGPLCFLVLMVATLIHSGDSLKCYKCNGCETSTPATEQCRDVDPMRQSVACLTQIVRVGGVESAMTVKKCTHYDKDTKYECTPLPDTAPVTCTVCNGDFCNGGSSPHLIKNRLSWALVALFLIAVPHIF